MPRIRIPRPAARKNIFSDLNFTFLSENRRFSVPFGIVPPRPIRTGAPRPPPVPGAPDGAALLAGGRVSAYWGCPAARMQYYAVPSACCGGPHQAAEHTQHLHMRGAFEALLFLVCGRPGVM